ncbi:hypothetical protein PVK06_023144 [Gossypium arboreum]|uniref:Uncharacterized protein n=1 Tax=Gossypium arboreum TaxID=29729 RepID=A0ABR0PAH3_GOSAR|nr:hypothetical protein PVK06_023144 [Gossypium arboreum]
MRAGARGGHRFALLKWKCYNGITCRVCQDGLEVALFSELEHVPTELEPYDSNDDHSDHVLDSNPRFRAYEPPFYKHNIDLPAKSGLEFSQLLYRRTGYASSSSNVQILEVGMKYPSKDVFLTTLKRYSFKNNVNYYDTESCSKK